MDDSWTKDFNSQQTFHPVSTWTKIQLEFLSVLMSHWWLETSDFTGQIKEAQSFPTLSFKTRQFCCHIFIVFNWRSEALHWLTNLTVNCPQFFCQKFSEPWFRLESKEPAWWLWHRIPAFICSGSFFPSQPGLTMILRLSVILTQQSPPLIFLSKWVKRQHAGRGRRGRGDEGGAESACGGFGGGLMEIETRGRKLRGNWVFITETWSPRLCSSSRGGPPLSRDANSHVEHAVVHEATQAAAGQLFKTRFSLIHLQTDDTLVNKAGGERWALSNPSKPVIQGAHVKTL